MGRQIGHYKILAEIGSGGMGVVYRAEDLDLGRTVAIKLLPGPAGRDPESEARFLQEARAASALDHPNICTVHEIGRAEDGRLFLVMACYEGRTLRDRLREGPLPLDEALDVAEQLLQALDRAHGAGIVHRDVKPANLFLTADGLVKLLDFGVAKLAGQGKLTRTGSTLGTAATMSPEQVRGEEVDARSDLWAVGVVLYEMIVGRTPFRGEHEQAVLYAILHVDPEPLTGLRAGVPPDLDRLVARCLARDRAERHQRAADLLADIRRCRRQLAAPGGAAPTDADASRRRRAGERRRRLVVLPFENLGSPQDEYFSAGMTEEITSRLASVSGLGVISRKSALHYAGRDRTTRQIAQELGVDYLLEGSVRWARGRAGTDRVRIAVQLIGADDDTHMWAETYDRELADVFALQSDIAGAVVAQLGAKVLGRIVPPRPEVQTQDLEAYQAYLRGRYFAERPHFTVAHTERAIAEFAAAAARDPSFAAAFAGLALGHARLSYYWHDASPERLRLGREAIDRALALAPSAPAIRLAHGHLRMMAERDAPGALAEFDALVPLLADRAEIMTVRAEALRMAGRWEEATGAYEEACRLSPRGVAAAVELALTYWWLRRYGEAFRIAERALTLAPDDLWTNLAKILICFSADGSSASARACLAALPEGEPWTTYILYFDALFERSPERALAQLTRPTDGWIRLKIGAWPVGLMAAQVHALRGDRERARAEADSARIQLEGAAADHPDDPRYHASLGVALAVLGRTEEALREGRRAIALYPVTRDAVYGLPYLIDLAHIQALVGRADDAIEGLRHLLTIPSWISPAWLRVDPRWDPLRREPGFQRLLASPAPP